MFCNVNLFAELMSVYVKTYGAVLGYWRMLNFQFSVLVTIELSIGCFFFFYLYMNFKPCYQTSPLK